MAKATTADDLRGLSRAELNAKVIELKEELFHAPLPAPDRAARVTWPTP